nr:MAG TPA: hypothetical protein [Caudoviricetes sp.]
MGRQYKKLDMAVGSIQAIRDKLFLLDKLYSEMNEETLEALHGNADYKLIEDWSSHWIEFKGGNENERIS